MKPIFLPFIFLMIFLPGYCQVIWFPTGATWHYEFSAFLGSGYTKLEVLDEDTLIGNHVYKKLLSTTIFNQFQQGLDTFTEYLYVFEENRIITGYDQWGSSFLYDFNAVEGDTLEYMYFGGLSPSPFVVDSIGQIEMNEILFQFQDIRFPSLYNQGEYDEMRVVEGIGSVGSHLFHHYTIIQPFDAPFYSLRCYEDANVGLINFSYNQAQCDYLEDITSTSESTNVKTLITPNPATDFVNVYSDSRHIEKIVVVDLLGKIRMRNPFTEEKPITIDISTLENGLFFILGMDQTGEIHFSERVTKCGS